MKKALLLARPVPLSLAFCLFATLAPLSGCISDDDYTKTVSQFQQASTTLTQAYQSFLANANVVEEAHFIDGQVFEAKPLDPASIQEKDLLTADEIKLRASAITALADYTTALAALAAGNATTETKGASQAEADASAASSSLKTLASNSSKAIADSATHATAASKTHDYSEPISSAVGAIGDVIALIEKHHSEAEVKESLTKNDPQVKALFDLIIKESRELYSRQKSALGETGITLFSDYETARQAKPVNPAELLQLSDRIKQYQKDSAAIGDTNPAEAIAAFQSSHDALVEAILAPKDKKKESMEQLIATVKAFATEVKPLAKDLYGFGSSL